eukprot:3084412-Prymnesium_polylepis.1
MPSLGATGPPRVPTRRSSHAPSQTTIEQSGRTPQTPTQICPLSLRARAPLRFAHHLSSRLGRRWKVAMEHLHQRLQLRGTEVQRVAPTLVIVVVVRVLWSRGLDSLVVRRQRR